MNESSPETSELMMRLLQGQLDELTPAQVAQLEAELNASDEAAARLADVLPPRDELVAAAHDTPSVAEWDAMFDRVATASAPTAERVADSVRERRVRPPHAILRIWGTFAAAAACVGLAMVWRIMPTTPPQDAWELRLSDHVVVERLEVFDDATSFVNFVDDDGTAVIWVFEPDGEDAKQGA